MTAAVLLAMWLRRLRVVNFWSYVIGPGVLSWAALHFGGLHPALAMVPIVPLMPHARRDLGLFTEREAFRRDTLSRFEHWWIVPVQFILLFFGFANAGVPFSNIGPGTWYVVAGLVVGKPLGIMLFTGLARLAGGRLPHGFSVGDLLLVGVAASIGFTVALFFATAAFPPGPALAETKMGAVLSVVGAPLAFVVARVIRPRVT
jgi:NhaA family Na+:H+ antiporter